MFKKGDRVQHNGYHGPLNGTVTDVEYDSWLNAPTFVTVAFDDSSFGPREMRVPAVEVKHLDLFQPIFYAESHCNCGLKFCREGGRHSDWCNAYRRDQ